MLRFLKSWGGGVVIITVAAVALVVVSWRSLESQKELVWKEAHEEAQKELNIRMNTFSRFLRQWPLSECESPESALSYGDVQFDPTADREQLEQWALSPEFTTSGLQVARLAQLHLVRNYDEAKLLAGDLVYGTRDFLDSLRLSGGRNRISRNGDLIPGCGAADFLAPNIMKALAEKFPEEDFSAFQSEFENGLNFRRKVWTLDLLHGPEWIVHLETLYLVGSSSYNSRREVKRLSPDDEALNAPPRPPWMSLHVSGDHWMFKDDEVSHGTKGDRLEIGFQYGMTIEVGVKDPDLLEAPYRQRKAEMLRILALAFTAILAGLGLMIRNIFREKKLAHAQSQFVSSVTHELRAPVGSMRLLSDALVGGKLTPEKEKEFQQLISRESGRLSVLIENVMDLARVEDGNRSLNREDIVMSEFVGEVIDIMTPLAEEKKLTLSAEGDEKIFRADSVAFRQILVNLIDNAIKFSPPDGTVTVSWKNGYSLLVIDQGPGVPADQQKKIFQRFYRAGDELRRETKGVGIGLSLVKNLVELHGGEISVINDPEKGGAIFKVKFPRPQS